MEAGNKTGGERSIDRTKREGGIIEEKWRTQEQG
jgi:hypothetical protein